MTSRGSPSKPLLNKKVLITAGPTREHWDPVRYLTNNSSGTMGLALAHEAWRLGAKVVVVLGPAPAPGDPAFKIVRVVSARDMDAAVTHHLSGADYFIGAAAVSDYRPAVSLRVKLKRHDPLMSLKLAANPDILARVGHLKKNRPRCVVGFALETNRMIPNAKGKLRRKGLDWIVANRESNMGQSDGSGILLSRWGDRIPLKKTIKIKLAKKIWQTILLNN